MGYISLNTHKIDRLDSKCSQNMSKRIQRKEHEAEAIRTENQTLEEMIHIQYLGSVISDNVDYKKEVRTTTTTGKTAFN